MPVKGRGAGDAIADLRNKLPLDGDRPSLFGFGWNPENRRGVWTRTRLKDLCGILPIRMGVWVFKPLDRGFGVEHRFAVKLRPRGNGRYCSRVEWDSEGSSG